MIKSTQTFEFFDTTAQVLARCTVIGLAVLFFWFGAIVLAGDLVYSIHGAMFGMAPHELNVIHYCGMGIWKLVVGCFFFIPWLSIRMVLGKARA